MTREIALYGRLRDAGLGDAVHLELDGAATAADALAALKTFFGEKAALLDGAALASEDAVLASKDPLPPSGTLAVLPPVCGG